jgi:hypothetical protein
MPNGPSISDSTLPGVKDFYLVFVHFYEDLGFSSTPDIRPSAGLFTYKVTITKAPSQFRQDLQTLAGILNFPFPKSAFAYPTPPASQHSPGYFAYQEIQSQFDTSSIGVSVTTSTKGKAATSVADRAQAPQKLTPNKFSNQPPSYIGLSFAMPVTSYKDVTYVPSSGTVGPTKVTRQNLYATLDFYYPAAVPDQRWLTLSPL